MSLRLFKSAAALTLATALSFSLTTPALAAGRSYDDFDEITSHVDLAVPQKLAIASPGSNITTSADAYYLTGSSSPKETLTLNGEEVANRGIYGSWGAYVTLSPGENLFTITQGGQSQSVTITKSASGTVTTTDSLSSAYPPYESAYHVGDTITFSVVAPYGATVWVRRGGRNIELSPVAAAQQGVPTRYKGSITLEGGNLEPQGLGPVIYEMSWKGQTKTLESPGNLYLYPREYAIHVQVIDTVATIYKSGDNNNQISTVVRTGAIDKVVAQSDEKYQLAMGGWIYKDSVSLLQAGSTSANKVSAVGFSSDSSGESFTLTGSTNPIATTWQTEEKLYIKLHHTSGVSTLPTADSKLFSGVTVTTEEDSTVLEFAIRPGQSLWGHLVEYKDGVTTIYAKYPPKASGNQSKPLSGLTIGLDAGHGGSDPGAFGVHRLNGPVEKDITYATAIATKKRLESLGATVLLTTYRENQKSTPTDRMQAASDNRADFYLSLHGNSVAGNGLKPQGVEVYYYYTRSKALADKLSQNIAAETGRQNRGGKTSAFRVTLNSLTPAVLVEMGFLSNPVEYDRMCSKQGIYQVANAIGNSLIGLTEV